MSYRNERRNDLIWTYTTPKVDREHIAIWGIGKLYSGVFRKMRRGYVEMLQRNHPGAIEVFFAEPPDSLVEARGGIKFQRDH